MRRTADTASYDHNPSRSEMNHASRAFEEVVVEDLIPMIDVTYRTLPDRDHRAMAGLSMGGIPTLQINMNHLDLFAEIGGFGGGGVGFGGGSFD